MLVAAVVHLIMVVQAVLAGVVMAEVLLLESPAQPILAEVEVEVLLLGLRLVVQVDQVL
jgi:hypothetical protein